MTIRLQTALFSDDGKHRRTTRDAAFAASWGAAVADGVGGGPSAKTLVDNGQLTADVAARHPRRNVIMASLAGRENEVVGFDEGAAVPGAATRRFVGQLDPAV